MTGQQLTYDRHPEVFHYTDKDGLFGILESQTLWATHARHLNDTTELQLAQGILADRLVPTVKKVIGKRFRDADSTTGSRIRQSRRAVLEIARQKSRSLANSFYSTSFEDSRLGPALAEPYVTSFCAHTDDQDYERSNGLLSQWRGYGNGGGYAIVFDTKKMCSLYKLEDEGISYNLLHFSDVVYSHDNAMIDSDLGEQIDIICSEIPYYFENSRWNYDRFNEIFTSAWVIFTKIKHRSFFEEREVRAVFFPITKRMVDHFGNFISQHIPPGKQVKEVFFGKGGKPYIKIFDKMSVDLQIKRIIVGPQKEQDKAAQEISNRIKERNIEIYLSETPLIS